MILFIYLFIQAVGDRKKPELNYFYIVSLILYFDGWNNFPRTAYRAKAPRK